MNHYEELGLPVSASLDDIRQAYRNLARLLHPDQQQDEQLRRLAECQMKRLNAVYVVLSDPDRRRRYDTELEARASERHTRIIVAPLPAQLSPPHYYFGIVTWVATAILGIAGITWFVTRDASQSPLTSQVAVASAEQLGLTPASRESEPPRPREDPFELGRLRTQLAESRAERNEALTQSRKLSAAVEALASRLADEREKSRLRELQAQRSPLPEPPVPVTAPPPLTPSMAVAAAARMDAPPRRYGGTWFYAPPKIRARGTKRSIFLNSLRL